MKESASPVAKAEMQIRRPVADVFDAFVDPSITSKFWFTKGSGRLEVGKPITWDWEMYNFSAEVTVKEVEPNKRIRVDWGAYESPTEIEWIFTSLPDDSTFVSVTNRGFTGEDNNRVKQAIESTEGFRGEPLTLYGEGQQTRSRLYSLGQKPGWNMASS